MYYSLKHTAAVCVALFSLSAQPLMAEEHSAYSLQIQTDKPQQVMDGFGASDAWSFQHIGMWPKEKQTQVADWFFSRKTDAKGQPLGIGLNIWRFNLGAGSTEQGKKSRIENEGNRTECLMNADGKFDWTKQQGQRNFMKLAKERGENVRFLAFLNSPPVYYTKNGLATNFGRKGDGYNLKEDKYEAFSRFIVKALQGIEKKDGIHFSYISPVNEPDGHWNWTGTSQEGTPATNREIVRLVRLLSKDLQKARSTTQILVNESSDYRCLLGIHQTKWDRGYTLRTFYTPDSTETYIGNLPNVLPLIGAHSYWTNTPVSTMKEIRQRLGEELAHYGKGFWQTETCIMSNDEEIGFGGGFDRSMKTALYVARIIHHDLVFANAKSWQWWRAVGGDYKDGLLRSFDATDPQKGRVVDSKLLWALGNYSYFIRPGAVRYPLTVSKSDGRPFFKGDTDPVGLMISAFKNPDGKWVVVAINYADKELALSLPGQQSWKAYRTSAYHNEHITPVGELVAGKEAVTLPRSITTFVEE